MMYDGMTGVVLWLMRIALVVAAVFWILAVGAMIWESRFAHAGAIFFVGVATVALWFLLQKNNERT